MNEQNKLQIGKIITTPQNRDAIHCAIAPVEAGESLHPGEHIGIHNGKALRGRERLKTIGIVDPFLGEKVDRGQAFWLFLYPGSITSLRHEWTHPAFEQVAVMDAKSASREWMRHWAVKHVSEDYYGDRGHISDEEALAFAIKAGHELNVGPYEDARDHIDNEWWNHWEIITGNKGSREEYFSCSC